MVSQTSGTFHQQTKSVIPYEILFKHCGGNRNSKGLPTESDRISVVLLWALAKAALHRNINHKDTAVLWRMLFIRQKTNSCAKMFIYSLTAPSFLLKPNS